MNSGIAITVLYGEFARSEKIAYLNCEVSSGAIQNRPNLLRCVRRLLALSGRADRPP